MSFYQGSWRGGQRKVGSREGDEIIKSNEFRIQFFVMVILFFPYSRIFTNGNFSNSSWLRQRSRPYNCYGDDDARNRPKWLFWVRIFGESSGHCTSTGQCTVGCHQHGGYSVRNYQSHPVGIHRATSCKNAWSVTTTILITLNQCFSFYIDNYFPWMGIIVTNFSRGKLFLAARINMDQIFGLY